MGMFDFIGDVFSSVFNNTSANKVNRDNIRFQQETNAANIAMQRETNAANKSLADAANAKAEEAARNSILWRVEDANRAGIHPLYAVGAPGISLSPTTAFQQAPQSVAPRKDVVPTVDYRSMGQNLDRAVHSMRTKGERAAAAAAAADQAMTTKTLEHIAIDHGMLQNDLLRAQIARLGAEQGGPPAPSFSMGGSSPSPRVQPLPATPTINSIYDNGREAGNITDYSYTRTGAGSLMKIPSQDYKNRTDEDLVGNIMWNWRNRMAPFFTKNNKVPDRREFPLPKGQQWGYDRWTDSYRPFYSSSRKWAN